MSDAEQVRPETDPLPPPPPAAPPGEGAPKAELGKRIVALIIDAVLVGIIGLAIPAIGSLIGAAYMLLRDGLDFDFMHHRSIGKHVMKLRVSTVDGAEIDATTSIRRNWMFAIGTLLPLVAVPLLIIPIVGWLVLAALSLAVTAIGVLEVVLVLTDPDGRRLGDKMAATRVIEA